MVWLLCGRVEVVVEFVHGGNDSCNACRVVREEQGCIFVDLYRLRIYHITMNEITLP